MNSMDKNSQDNRARQLNDEMPEYHRARGLSPEAAEHAAEQARLKNRAASPATDTTSRKP